jgi:hypothetical protein
MAMDKFEEVNQAEERENARGQRAARLRAMWRAHPVWFTLGALLAVYAFTLGDLLLKPGHIRGSSVFLWAGIIALVGFVFLLLRLWLQSRARRARSDWT